MNPILLLQILAVSAAEAYSKGKVQALKIIQILILGLNFVLLALIWFISSNRISKPLNQLIHIINNLNVSENIPRRVRSIASKVQN